MRTILGVLFTIATGGLAHAQTPTPPSPSELVRPMQPEEIAFRDLMKRAQVRAVSLAVRQVELHLGATLIADQITVDQRTVRLQRNAMISFANGVVITADDAVIANAEIRLGGNAVVRVPPK